MTIDARCCPGIIREVIDATQLVLAGQVGEVQLEGRGLCNEELWQMIAKRQGVREVRRHVLIVHEG